LTAVYQFIIIPILNVDGYDFTHTNTRLWRKNRQSNPGSTCIGTDNNRNYGSGWGGPGSSPTACADTYRGPSAFSTTELISQRNFLTPRFSTMAIACDIHAYGAMFMSPYGNTNSLPPDFPQMNLNMQAATDAIWGENGRTYAYGSVANVIYLASGGSNDWWYGGGGCLNSYAIEVFGSSFTPPVSWILPIGSEMWAGLKRLCYEVKQQKGL